MGLQRNAIATRCNPIAMPMRMQCDGAVAIGMLLQCDCNATRCDCNATALFGRRPPSSSVFPKAHGKKGGDVRGEGEGRWFLPPGPRGHEGGRRKDAIATQCDCNAMRLPRNAMRLQFNAIAMRCECNAMQCDFNAAQLQCNGDGAIGRLMQSASQCALIALQRNAIAVFLAIFLFRLSPG